MTVDKEIREIKEFMEYSDCRLYSCVGTKLLNFPKLPKLVKFPKFPNFKKNNSIFSQETHYF